MTDQQQTENPRRPVPILIDPVDDDWTVIVNGLRRYKVKPEGKRWVVVDLRRGGDALSDLEQKIYPSDGDALKDIVSLIVSEADEHV